MWGQVLKFMVCTSSLFTVYHGLTLFSFVFRVAFVDCKGVGDREARLDINQSLYAFASFVFFCLKHSRASWSVAGVVHRDIKPENFMYGRGGKAHIGFCCFHWMNICFPCQVLGCECDSVDPTPVRVSSFCLFHQIHHLHLIDFGLSDTYWGRLAHWSLRVVEPGLFDYRLWKPMWAATSSGDM